MRGKGEGSVFKDKYGYWNSQIELPRKDGQRVPPMRRRFKTKPEALAHHAKTLAELKKRGSLRTSTPTVEQYLNRWLDEKELDDSRPNTIAGYRTLAAKHIIPTIGSKKLGRVTTDDIKNVTDTMLAKGLSSTYALYAQRVLSSAFSTAISDGIVGYNPARERKAPRKEHVELQALELHDSLKLLRYLGTVPDSNRYTLALFTGARRGEVIGLEAAKVVQRFDPMTGIPQRLLVLDQQLLRIKWAHGCGETCGRKRGADCPDRTIRVPKDYEKRLKNVAGGLWLGPLKSREGNRVIPLIGPLEKIIDEQLAINPTGLLFRRPDGSPHDPDQHTAEWQRIFDGAGIKKDVRLHDLRHSAVDLLLAAGVPAEVVRLIVGHATIAQTLAYASRSQTDPRIAAAMQQYVAFLAPRTLERAS